MRRGGKTFSIPMKLVHFLSKRNRWRGKMSRNERRTPSRPTDRPTDHRLPHFPLVHLPPLPVRVRPSSTHCSANRYAKNAAAAASSSSAAVFIFWEMDGENEQKSVVRLAKVAPSRERH